MNTRVKRNEQTLRILIVDPVAHSRENLATFLKLQESLAVIGQAEHAAEAIHISQRHRPDVVIMDVNLPNVDGLTATRQLMALNDPPAVILLTVHQSYQKTVEAQEAGAAAYIETSAGVDELLKTLQKLLLNK